MSLKVGETSAPPSNDWILLHHLGLGELHNPTVLTPHASRLTLSPY